jgi:hypothetical protein
MYTVTEEQVEQVLDQTLRVNGIAPGLDELNVETIALGLAREQRFGNRLPRGTNYSVAEHSVILSHQGDPKYALFKLFHDATEFIFRDIPGPLKALMPQYKMVEKTALPVIIRAMKLDLDPTECGDYKPWDNDLCVFEAFKLFKNLKTPEHIEKKFPDLVIEELNVEDAYESFMTRYHELTA